MSVLKKSLYVRIFKSAINPLPRVNIGVLNPPIFLHQNSRVNLLVLYNLTLKKIPKGKVVDRPSVVSDPQTRAAMLVPRLGAGPRRETVR